MLLSPSKPRNTVSIARETGTKRSTTSVGEEIGSMRESGVTKTGTALPVVCLSLGELHLRVRGVFPLAVCVVIEVVVALIDMLLLVIDTRVGDMIVSLPGMLDMLLLVFNTSLGGAIEALSLRGLTNHVFPLVVVVLLR